MPKEESAVIVDASAPGGFKGSISFRDSLNAEHVLHLLLVMGIFAILYLIFVDSADRERRYGAMAAALAQVVVEVQKSNLAHDKLLANMASINTEARVQTYVITLEPEQRKKLNLAMPDELRQRLNMR